MKKTQELRIVVYFDCEAVNRKVSEKETEQDIMAIGAFYNISEYYKPYFLDYVRKYKKFAGMTAPQDFIKELKKSLRRSTKLLRILANQWKKWDQWSMKKV